MALTAEERRKLLGTNKKKKSEDEEIEDAIEMGDMFDVVKEVVKVNSPISTMNPDFIFIDLKPEMLENPLIEYVKSQLQVVEIINIHLSSTKLQDNNWRLKVNQILLNKVYSTVILSRGYDGKVIKAILDYIRRQSGSLQEPQPLQPLEEVGEPQQKKILGIIPRGK